MNPRSSRSAPAPTDRNYPSLFPDNCRGDVSANLAVLPATVKDGCCLVTQQTDPWVCDLTITSGERLTDGRFPNNKYTDIAISEGVRGLPIGSREGGVRHGRRGGGATTAKAIIQVNWCLLSCW